MEPRESRSPYQLDEISGGEVFDRSRDPLSSSVLIPGFSQLVCNVINQGWLVLKVPRTSLGTIDTSLFSGDEGVPPSSIGQSGLVLQGEELVWTPGAELGELLTLSIGLEQA